MGGSGECGSVSVAVKVKAEGITRAFSGTRQGEPQAKWREPLGSYIFGSKEAD
jgi:hypothetical protein